MASRAAALRHHLFSELLPLWDERGVDRAHGGFHNALTPELEPVPEAEKRLLVQARQLWVFAHGARLGGPAFCLPNARRGFEFLMERFWDRRHGGWYRTTAHDGEPADRGKDCYDHAFVLFALAEYGEVGGETAALERAAATLDLLEARLRDRAAGGFREGASEDWTPLDGPRRQNPHMHLLEALLALHGATRERRYLERIAELVALFSERFFDGATGTLGEFFEPDWRPAAGERGRWVEPGHHFEWVWLLHAVAEACPELGADFDCAAHAERLFRFAAERGVDPVGGGVFDAVDREGRVLRDTHRVWPQTERVQAHAARSRAGCEPGGLAPLGRALDHCLIRYRRPGGRGWHERLDGAGAVISDRLPATTPYHIVQALSHAVRELERGDGGG